MQSKWKCIKIGLGANLENTNGTLFMVLDSLTMSEECPKLIIAFFFEFIFRMSVSSCHR